MPSAVVLFLSPFECFEFFRVSFYSSLSVKNPQSTADIIDYAVLNQLSFSIFDSGVSDSPSGRVHHGIEQ